MKTTFTKILSVLFITLYAFNSSGQVTLVRNVQIGTPVYAVNGKLLFAGDSLNSNTYQLWVSDGTTAGTHFLKTFSTVAGSQGYMQQSDGAGWRHYDPVVFNDNLYFFAFTFFKRSNGTTYSGWDLWKSDGTVAGTIDVGQFASEWSGTTTFTAGTPSFCILNNVLYIAAGNNNSTGVNLWKTDGTALTKVVNIASNGFDGWGPAYLTVFNNAIYFVANDAVSGPEIWKSDGTAAGTHILKDIFPGADGVTNRASNFSGINPRFTVSGNYLYFIGWRNQLFNFLTAYRTDGTDAGTTRLDTTISSFDAQTFLYPYQADVNGTYFFTGYPNGLAVNTSGLMKSDGTAAGTMEVVTNNNLKSHGVFTSFKNKLYFDGAQGAGAGLQFGLCVSDGSTAGTSMVYSFPYAGSDAQTQDFLNTGNALFFRELMKVSAISQSWRMVQTNGTAAGTKIHYGAVALSAPTLYNGNIFFWGNDTISGSFSTTGLYKLIPAPDNASLPVGLINFTASLNNSRQVQLAWQTANETNNKGFYIEHGTDGKQFTTLHFLQGAGTSTQTHQYNWTDEYPSAGSNFYRLRQADIDNKITYSQVRRVDNMLQHRIVITPNLVTGNTLTIQHNLAPGKIQVQIADMNGSMVWEQSYNITAAPLQCNIQSLKAGVYQLRIINAGKELNTCRFVKE